MCSDLHLILEIPSAKLITRFYNELAIHLIISIGCNLKYLDSAIFFSFLLVLMISFSVGPENVTHFPVFSPKQVSYLLNFSASSVMIKVKS